jgi:hypothetical protein
MKTISSRFLRSSAAVATAAVLAFLFTIGGPQVGRADDPETASSPGQEMVLVPAKSIDALELRVIHLEETVAALSQRWQQISAHRLCVSDDTGAETCITKAQLDSFLNQAPHAEINQPAVLEATEASPPAAAITSAATEPLPSSEPTIIVGENVSPDDESETTGTVNSAISGAAAVSTPETEEDPGF